MLRWLWDNKGSLLLSFVLAVTVWVASVVAQDPTVEREMDEPIPISYTPPSDGLLVVGDPPTEVRLTIKAPESVWQEISPETITVEVDLAGLQAGVHSLELNPSYSLKPLRIVSVDPETTLVKLEPELSLVLPVTVRMIGDPAITYDAEDPVVNPEEATVVGPTSLVTDIVELRADVNVAGTSQDIEQTISLVAIDENDETVEGVEITPDPVTVSIPIVQSNRFRLLSVIPDLVGSPAAGYRTIAFTVIPNEILVTTSDPSAFDSLAGFLETETIDISGATETVDQIVLLDLPPEITPATDQTVRVIVTIVPIETSKTFDLPVEVQNLAPGLAAIPSPERVTLLLEGPLTILDELQPEDVRVVLNLVGFDVGLYEDISPEVIIASEEITFEIFPSTVGVEIIVAPPTTPTPAP
jgi:YbbR domain-containing protein